MKTVQILRSGAAAAFALCIAPAALAADAAGNPAAKADAAAAVARPASAAASSMPPVAPAAKTPAQIASKNWGATNPAVKATETSKTPGLDRPRQPVVPQVTVPFRGAGDTTSKGAVTGGGVDDSAARCLATSGPEQRRACEEAARDQAADAKRNGSR